MRTLSVEDRIKILKDVVSFKTVNDNELEVCDYLQNLFKNYGIDSKIDIIKDKRANLIATIGDGKPVLGISGHMDVVHEGDPNDWSYDPFTLTEDNGYLYGRGAGDMKSGLVALAIALIEIKNNNLLENGTIKFMATAGEEMEQSGSKQIYEKGEMDDVDALIIAEPSENMIVYAHKGSMDFRIISKGTSAHSSIPSLGKNAILPLIQLVQNINEEFQDISNTIQYKKLDFGNLLNALQKELPKKELTINENLVKGLVISNTIIKGGSQVNSIPDYAVAEFNVRTVPEYDNKKVKHLFEKHIQNLNSNEAKIEQEIYLDLDPVITTGKNKLVKAAMETAKKHFSNEVFSSPTLGVTDASNLLKGKNEQFPFVMFGPGERPHQINERVSKSSYLNFIDYYIDLFVKYFE
ncbi:TPA: ArgE/DapE family deacylase [Staphylococcus pseudintermedius]